MERATSRLSKAILKFWPWVYVLVYGYFFAVSIFATQYKDLHSTMQWIVLGAIGLFVLLVVLGGKGVFSVKPRILSNSFGLSALFLVIFGLHFIFAYALEIKPGQTNWDPQTMYRGATDLLAHPHHLTQAGYFIRFPNNLGMLHVEYILLRAIRFFGLYPHRLSLMVAFNVLILDLTFLLTYLYVRFVFGAKASVYSLILGFIFIVLSPWSRTLYTDTLGMLFTISSVWLATLFHDSQLQSKRIIYSACLGLIIGLGALIKPTTIFAGLPALIISLLVTISKSAHPTFNLKKCGMVLLPIFLSITMGLSTYLTLNLAMEKNVRIHSNPMPPVHFAMMGLTKICTHTECRYGAWDYPDAIKATTFKSMGQYQKYAFRQVKKRINAYGPFGYVQFETEKGAWIIGDGTFYAYKEGTEAKSPLLHNDKISKRIQYFMHPSGPLYVWFRAFLQSFWVVTIAASLFCFRKSAHSSPESSFSVRALCTGLLGILAFLLVFEARSRYLYLYIPLFISLASYSLTTLQESGSPGRLLASIFRPHR